MFTLVGVGAGVTAVLQFTGIAVVGALLSNVVKHAGAEKLALVVDIGTYCVLGFLAMEGVGALLNEVEQVFLMN